jgi:Tfp pilus assembly protein PilZ
MDQPDDRRRDRRFDKVFSVYIAGAWGSAFGIARNISEGGMFIESSDPYPLGSRMQVTFYLPESDAEMTAEGEVVHLCFLNRTAGGGTREVLVGMGVRFTGFLQQEAHQVNAQVAMAQLQ